MAIACKNSLSREQIGIGEALERIKKGCEPDHTTEEFTWGLLASMCEVKDSEAYGLIVRLEPWAQSHRICEEEYVLDSRGPDEYDMAAKRYMLQAIEHLLRVFTNRHQELAVTVTGREMTG
ncbi:MAG TPA: hypothetical protein ENH62_03550 [Marinobacter sp.]|uniref:Uncharacterized protein n=1 Tax=marine sediment metagenome TaxID=412755 RepID=A0A0F9RJ81_9ZZZZ|nr:hypothetical protein [Marinobacter sp.]